ncbi:peptidoglycan-binding domain-containing protein [Paraliomyxa miuraensis]|uniref:peptidoglycan-binding domain-containing protein n=1 Tax=Paraliomyxa miuraensis TaxID=376150 RepID=UPI00225B41E7|nr:peptidoglycan-binding domain-containing protein [Paraliomyxa miuraensis]MCX4247631.1 peptidoglycan-binding protein [Paraliomyxa miuraensis]
MTTREHPVEVTLRGHVVPMQIERAMHHRIVVTRPVVRRPRRAPFRAAPRSGLLVPAPWTDDVHPISYILAGIHAARSAGDALLLVVGHVAPAEARALGRARAEALRCVVESDAAAWVELAQTHGTLADVKAYLQYLNAMLGWSCAIDVVDETRGPSTERAIAAFQQEYDDTFGRAIDVDGICGPQTLGALFEVMRMEWNKWLLKHGLGQEDVDALDIRWLDGSGLDPTLPGVVELRERSGVDLLVVPRAALGADEATVELVYGSTVARYEVFDVPLEPWAWVRGPYTIVTDLLPDEPAAKEVYLLRSMDGEFETRLTLPDDAVDTGVLELQFFALPCDKRYELRVTVHDGETYPLFSDVPYCELHRLACDGQPQEAS